MWGNKQIIAHPRKGTYLRERTQERRIPLEGSWRSRLCLSALLSILAVVILASGGGKSTMAALPVEHMDSASPTEILSTRGAAQALCLPFDIACYLSQVSDTLVKNAFETVRPLLDGMQQNAFNVVTQTPTELTYNHPQVQKVATWALAVVDAALLVLVGIAGYQIMMGRTFGSMNQDLLALLPRIALSVLAAHVWQFITSLLIDLNNALCLAVSNLMALTLLQDLVKAVIKTLVNPLTGGQQGLLILLSIWIVCLLLLLLWQMLVRLALVILCVALSPLGLLCLALPLTQRWGQVWLSIFAHTVLIQFIQVTALALSGMLMAYLTEANLFHLDPAVISLLVGGTMLFLIRQLPGMLREYALRPIFNAGEQSGNALVTVAARAAATL